MATDTWVDFKAIKAAVSMEAVLAHYGLRKQLKGKSGELRGRCPIHKGEGEDAFHVNLEKNCFHCFSCEKRGNVLDFVAAMENCNVRVAALKLQEWFMVASADTPASTTGGKHELATKNTNSAGQGESRGVNEPLTFQLKGVDPDHPYLAERGISRETAELFEVGYFSGKGSMVGRIVIPIHNECGGLVAYAGRAIDESEPRYKLPAGFQKSLVLFNLHRASDSNTVVVVEGFFDCMKVHQAGFPCVALMGCTLTAEQERLLVKHFSGVILLLDGDSAGMKATDELLVKLGRHLWVKALSVPAGRQPDELSTEELLDVLLENSRD